MTDYSSYLLKARSRLGRRTQQSWWLAAVVPGFLVWGNGGPTVATVRRDRERERERLEEWRGGRAVVNGDGRSGIGYYYCAWEFIAISRVRLGEAPPRHADVQSQLNDSDSIDCRIQSSISPGFATIEGAG